MGLQRAGHGWEINTFTFTHPQFLCPPSAPECWHPCGLTASSQPLLGPLTMTGHPPCLLHEVILTQKSSSPHPTPATPSTSSSLDFSFFFKLEDNCFIILCWFLLYINMNQPQVLCICPLPLEPLSHLSAHPTPLGCHRAPGGASRVTPQILTGYLFHIC